MKKVLPKVLSNPQGFTLIELLVVISIIAILSVIGITVFNTSLKSARDARRKADLHAISIALQLYYQAKGAMPANQTPGWGYYQTQDPTHTIFLHELVDQKIMANIPLDPSYPRGTYGYYDYGPDSLDGALITTQLESISPTTETPPGSCRNWNTGNWCDTSYPNRWYCICTRY